MAETCQAIALVVIYFSVEFFFFFLQRLFKMCKCAYVAVLIQKCTHGKAVHVERTLRFSSESAVAEWVCRPYALSESFWNEILLIKSLWYVISSGFRQRTLELSLQWFFFLFLGPLYCGHRVPVKPNQLQLGLSDSYRGAAPEFSHVLPSLCGIPLLPLQSTFGACWTVLTDGSCSGHQASPSLLVFKKYLCLVQRM